MRLLLFLFFALIVAPIHANEAPSNAPVDQGYLVYDGKIYTFATGSSYDYDTTAFSCSTYEEAEAFVDAWYEWLAYYDTLGLPSVYEPGKPDGIRPNLSSWYPNPLSQLVIVPRYSGSEIVSYYVIWSVREHGTNTAKSSRLFKGAMAGLNTDWHATATPFNAFCVSRGVAFNSVPDNGGAHWIYYADAEYIDVPEEPEVTPPEGMADGCVTYYQGAWRYTSEREGPTADVIFRGPSLYADTEEDAERCASQFAAFLATYDWPWYGEPAVLPWSEPKVYKCYVIRGGAVAFVFWRVFFQDYTGDKMETVGQYDSAYSQCLSDYSMGAGGTGGYNMIEIYGPSATASASNTGSVQLNGNQLASGESGTSTVKLTSGSKDVAVTQYTVQKVDAEGDTVGTSEVTSEASVSEGSDGSINVTNHTTINTNLELGDAPAADSFTTEERQVSSSSDLLTETEPEYSYIVKGGSEDYSLDWEKFWSDVEDRLNEIFHFEDIKYFFDSGVTSSDMITDWTITVFGYSFVVPWSQVAQLEVVQFARTAMSYLCILGTCLASFKLMV